MNLFHNIIRPSSLFIIIAILSTSCIHSDYMINGITNAKSAWFIFMIGILLIFSASVYATDNLHFKLKKLDIAVCFFLLYPILNSFIRDFLLFSRKNIESIGLLLLYILLKRIYSDRKFLLETYTISLVVLTFIQIVITILQWNDLAPSYNLNFRFTGFFFNPSPFAIFLSVLVVYCLVVFFYHHNKIIKTVSISLFLVGILVVLITLCRSAWLGSLAGILLVLEAKFQVLVKLIRNKGLNVKIIITFLVIGLVTLTSFYLYNLKKDSADGRMLTWKLSMKMIQDNYVTGIGKDNFPVSFLNYQASYFRTHPERMSTEGRLAGETSFAFNDILQITAEQGIIGLVLTIILLIVITKVSIKLIKAIQNKSVNENKHSLIIGSITTLLVILVSGLFSYPLTLLPFQILFFNSLSILSANHDSIYEPVIIGRNPLQRIKTGIIAAVCFAGGVYYAWYGLNLYQGYKQWHLVESGNFESNDIEKLARDHPVLNEDPWFALKKGSYFLIFGEYDKVINILETAKQTCPKILLYHTLADAYKSVKKIDKAEQQYKFLTYAIPNRLRPRYRLAKLYYETGQTEKWEKQALEVLNFRPKIQSSITDDMISEIQDLLLSYKSKEQSSLAVPEQKF